LCLDFTEHMAGLYIHVPFCRKICSYCDFYKTATTALMPDFLSALDIEMQERASYLDGESLETIYFGGGTPSLIPLAGLQKIFERIYQNYRVLPDCEITIEANPDDLSSFYLQDLRFSTPVNRLSVGIQSFNDNDLKLLNRRHNAGQALQSIVEARNAGFKNITIDLIYGLPDMDLTAWRSNLEIAFQLDVQHISAYHLTIEPSTALARMKSRGLIHLPGEGDSSEQFMLLHKLAGEYGFVHYEISNLAKNGYLSRHNSNYWSQKKYLGLGPSAHSFNLASRQWNVSHIRKYIEAITNGSIYSESEVLNTKTRFNEYLMLSLRTDKGISISHIVNEYGRQFADSLDKNIGMIRSPEWISRQDDCIRLTTAGWMVSDYIVGRLMESDE
jgi:oxygen-independent coproporphyrinogen III oxidase